VTIFKEFMNRVVGLDIDVIATGIPMNQAESIRRLLEIIERLSVGNTGAAVEDIKAEAEKELKMPWGKCETTLDFMQHREKNIYKPKEGRYRIV
jgi:DNA replicative helicase MCM subunit Mcm2 (Cdc46/Mcm family)